MSASKVEAGVEHRYGPYGGQYVPETLMPALAELEQLLSTMSEPGSLAELDQDAELTAIQRILTGDQYMTVYKAIRPQAERAAEVAVALLRGDGATDQQWSGNETTGASAYDTATVSVTDGPVPTGTLTYTFFPDGSCQGSGTTETRQAMADMTMNNVLGALGLRDGHGKEAVMDAEL